jgi:hypothetical protein
MPVFCSTLSAVPEVLRCMGRGLLLGALLAASPTLAQQAGWAAALDPDTFPPNQVFRQLQLQTMACGRENSAEACQQARAMADPLMDHPRLPAACKDSIWSIREGAEVARTNTYERREALNRSATDLLALCKPATRPVGSGSTPAKTETSKPSGLGGLLRGLGIGGGGGGNSSQP